MKTVDEACLSNFCSLNELKDGLSNEIVAENYYVLPCEEGREGHKNLVLSSTHPYS